VIQGFGAGWLILVVWGSLGAVLGVALRGVALPIGLGVVWVLGIGAFLYHPLLLGVFALLGGIGGTIAGGPTARLARNGLIVASLGFFVGMIIAIGLGRPVA